jgi:hypothetical protein
MLRFVSTKDGIILYHIKHNIVLGCFVINGVTSCSRPKC